MPSEGLAHKPAGLVDVLDRVLDKGLVVVGDIRISVVNLELLTLNIRLLVCSIDKAQEIGIDWWRYSPMLNPQLQQPQSPQLPAPESDFDTAMEASTRRSKTKPSNGRR